MNTRRLATLVAATIITAAESLLFLWVLAPVRVEAATVVTTASRAALPMIVVTAHRDRGAHGTVLAGTHVYR